MKKILTFLFLFPISAFCCTDFLITTKDNTMINGRSMEFGHVFDTSIIVHPRGEKMQSTTPSRKPGMAWISTYGYVGLFDEDDQFFDGFNETGLSVGALWFPDGKYPEVTTEAPDKMLSFTDLPFWILGNFATVDELKTELPKIQVYAHKIPVFNAIPPIHLSIHDQFGDSLVVEFIDGEMKLFDNSIGVLTNAPAFPWQETNLRNYINLKAINTDSITLDGTVLTTTGQGSGMLGIPGDWTPPSRFVRIALYKDFLDMPVRANQGVTTAFHLLNTVDIPYGGIRSSQSDISDYTQWVVVKDLTNLTLYYRTYEDQNIYRFELNERMLRPGAALVKIKIPLESVAPPQVKELER
ncbi:MAG: Choloylglycine hydrolase [Chlamydiales bacterium]|nr:Choloylglycine hydrolase [Chlamydiales bacterium]MCH9619716.1 Choloylglycine hydrolase [Chlamydiales bacterium]MCH9623322.1 Choloylglycine hydrolase [Chlamydiales bacterium]